MTTNTIHAHRLDRAITTAFAELDTTASFADIAETVYMLDEAAYNTFGDEAVAARIEQLA